jgi:hypothetical protein
LTERAAAKPALASGGRPPPKPLPPKLRTPTSSFTTARRPRMRTAERLLAGLGVAAGAPRRRARGTRGGRPVSGARRAGGYRLGPPWTGLNSHVRFFALRSPSLVTKLDGVHSQHSSPMSMSLPRGGGGGHWSRQFSSHDDLCALNGHLTAANDEVLSSLFSRRRHQPSPEHSGLQALTPSTEGTRDSARKDFVQGVLPTERSRSVPPLDRLSALSVRRSSSAVSLAETSGSSCSAERQPSDEPSPSAHRRSSYSSTPARRASSEVNLAKARSTEIPSTLEACGAEIARLRGLLDAERVAVQVLPPITA